MRTVLVGGGACPDMVRLKAAVDAADCVLAADSGAKWLLEAGRDPDVLIGDFDSIPSDVLEICQKNGHTRWVRHRIDKDQTDMALCVEEALRLGTTSARIFGAVGSRLDHSLANLGLLHDFLMAGVPAWVEDANNRVTFLGADATAPLKHAANRSAGQCHITIPREDGFKVSLLALPPGLRHVTTRGLLYDMRGRDLPFGSTLAVSNEFLEDEADISFLTGMAWLLLSRDG